MVDTSKVLDRRTLAFTKLDEVLADAEQLAEAERAGTLRCSGNWTVGQTFGHLATWIDFAYDGYPKQVNPPWFIRMIIRLRRNSFLVGPMPVGVRIPRVPGGTMGTEVLPREVGLSRLRAALARLKAAPPEKPNPLFGPLSHADWIALNLRHAELHLSFLHPN